MQGKLYVIKASGEVSEEALTNAPSLETLQSIVGGYIQIIPSFSTYRGAECVAFCNEEGKLDGLPVNRSASVAWQQAVGRFRIDDFLVGDVAVVCGDEELMADL